MFNPNVPFHPGNVPAAVGTSAGTPTASHTMQLGQDLQNALACLCDPNGAGKQERIKILKNEKNGMVRGEILRRLSAALSTFDNDTFFEVVKLMSSLSLGNKIFNKIRTDSANISKDDRLELVRNVATALWQSGNDKVTSKNHEAVKDLLVDNVKTMAKQGVSADELNSITDIIATPNSGDSTAQHASLEYMQHIFSALNDAVIDARKAVNSSPPFGERSIRSRLARLLLPSNRVGTTDNTGQAAAVPAGQDLPSAFDFRAVMADQAMPEEDATGNTAPETSPRERPPGYRWEGGPDSHEVAGIIQQAAEEDDLRAAAGPAIDYMRSIR